MSHSRLDFRPRRIVLSTPMLYIANDMAPNLGATGFGVASPQGFFGQMEVLPPTTTRLSAINRPSDLVMFAEGARDVEESDSDAGAFRAASEYVDTEYPTDMAYYASGLVWDAFIINVADAQQAVSQSGDASLDAKARAWTRHSGGANFAMADGHVKTLRPLDMPRGERWVANWPN